MSKKIPIGISDFKFLRNHGYEWIDKTLLIEEVIDSSPQVVLLPRPRRFGKTLNLSMLRYYFEKSEENHAGLFKGTLIQEKDDFYWREQGKYLVIFLTFKEVKGDNWELCYKKMCNALGEEIKRHLDYLPLETLDPNDHSLLSLLKQGIAEEHIVSDSLKLLTRILHQYFGERVIILIDEYDVPIHNAFLNGFYNKAIDLLRTLLGSALKDNSFLHKGVMTGALRIAKESIFTDLNNVSTYTLLQSKFSSHFGFTEEETFGLLKQYHLEEMRGDVGYWYNGYQFGQQTIYNPWSILSFIDSNERACKPFWINTSDNALIKELITKQDGSFKADIETLLNHKSITKSLTEHITLRDLNKNPDEVWSFLLFTGYLKCTSYRLDEENLDYLATLSIPNREVEYLFKWIVKWWLKQSLGNDIQSVFHNLTTGDIPSFTSQFQEYVLNSLSIFDLAEKATSHKFEVNACTAKPKTVEFYEECMAAKPFTTRKARLAAGCSVQALPRTYERLPEKQPERIYHAFVLGLLVQLQTTHEVKSNRESGYGRYDVLLIPKDPKQLGIIIEFKRTFSDRGDTLESAADAALNQIEEKQYAQELHQRSIDKVLALGIAFQGKQILVKHRFSLP